MFAMNASNLHSQPHQPSHFHGKDLHKLRVDHACQVEAKMANLPGSFVAMISTSPDLQPYALQEDSPVVNSKVPNVCIHLWKSLATH